MESLILNVAAGGAGGSAFFVQLFPLLLIFVVFYFFLIRPQQKRAKEHEAKINAVQKNDEVVKIRVSDDYFSNERTNQNFVYINKFIVILIQSFYLYHHRHLLSYFS